MDDLALPPVAPQLDHTIQQEQELASAEDKKTARAYFHPAWERVEEIINEGIANASAPIDKKLSAEEYKVQGVANELYAGKLKEIMLRIKDAVRAVEADRKQEGGN